MCDFNEIAPLVNLIRVDMGPEGFEPTTSRLSVERSNQAEPRALGRYLSLFIDIEIDN